MSDELTKAREALGVLLHEPGVDERGDPVFVFNHAVARRAAQHNAATHLGAALAEVDRLTLAAQALLRALDAHEDDSEEAYSTRWADDVYEAKSNLRDEMGAALDAAKGQS